MEVSINIISELPKKVNGFCDKTNASFDEVSSYAKDYSQDRFEDAMKNTLEGKFGKKFTKKAALALHWALALVVILADASLSAFSILNPNDITIYNRMNNHPDYLTVFKGFDDNISLEDIIQKVNDD